MEASGKEMRGAGTASATVRAALSPENGSGDESTLVTMHTTLNVTGLPAQFGRGVIAEVGSRLIDKFADNLAQQLGGGAAAEAPLASAAVPVASAPTAAAAAAPGAPAVAPPSAAEEAGTGAAAGAGETPAAGEAPAAPPAAATRVPVQSTAAPQATVRTAPVATAADQEDSLNLLSLVGPVIVKRLAPVVGAAVAAGLIAWGVRRIVRRRQLA